MNVIVHAATRLHRPLLRKMHRMSINYSLRLLRGDVFGGVTAAIIALPVALAFGVASGVGAEAGLYAAIAIGLFAAIFGGTPGMVSGPTAPMAVAMAVVVTHSANSLAEAFTIVMLTGLLQIIFGAIRIGRFIGYTPYSVISGFMTGIGVIIISMQILPMIGAPTATNGLKGTIENLPAALAGINFDAVSVAAITLVLMFIWPRKLHRIIPDTLGALAIGSLAGIFIFQQAPVVGTIPTGLPPIQLPVFTAEFLIRMVEPALVLAIIGSIESLLVALISDAMTRSRHNPNKEIIGQGIANIVSGLFGGLPGSGSPVPTVVSIQAGGRSRLAGIIVAVILCSFLFHAGKLAEQIPLAVLAALLLKIGWHVVDVRFISRIRQIDITHVTVMLVTAGLTVFVDLLTAVAIGLIVSGMVNAMHSEPLELDSVVSVPLLDLDADDEYSARTGLIRMPGRYTVASAGALTHVIGGDIRDHEVIIFDFSDTEHMDDSAVVVIRQLILTSYEQDKPCIIMGISEKMRKTFDSLEVLTTVDPSHCVETLEQARQLADRLLENENRQR